MPVPPARVERATPWFVARCSGPLSYGGVANATRPAGLEPATFRSTAGCSDRLSYSPIGSRAPRRVAPVRARRAPCATPDGASCTERASWPAAGATNQRMHRAVGVAFLLPGHHGSTADDTPRCTACDCMCFTWCLFPDHHLSNSGRRARRRLSCSNRGTAKRPTWHSAQVGRDLPLPKPVAMIALLPSTPSLAGPCTHFDLRLPSIIPAPHAECA